MSPRFAQTTRVQTPLKHLVVGVTGKSAAGPTNPMSAAPPALRIGRTATGDKVCRQPARMTAKFTI